MSEIMKITPLAEIRLSRRAALYLRKAWSIGPLLPRSGRKLVISFTGLKTLNMQGASASLLHFTTVHISKYDAATFRFSFFH